MHKFTEFQLGHWQGRAFEHIERERTAQLNAPPPRNDPRLMERVSCKVLTPFYVAGRVVEKGETVELVRHDAESMAALGRVKLL